MCSAKNMLTVDKFDVNSILCSAKKSSALNLWLKARHVSNDYKRPQFRDSFNSLSRWNGQSVRPDKPKGMKIMTKKKAAKRKPQAAAQKSVKKSAALKNHAATMVDIGQFFNNAGNMENLMSQGKSQFDKITNEANALGREGFDAFNKSITLFAKGFEDLLRTSMSIAQSSAEKQSQLVKDALSVKSLNEWADIQNRIAQENFDDAMAAATKLSELSVKLISESTAPINNQFAKGMKKATEALAA